MDSSSARDFTMRLREEFGVQTSHLRGQHFLVDDEAIQKVVEAADLDRGDTVVEVGPGLGVLTRKLAPLVKKLVVVELDPFFVCVLKQEFAELGNVEIIEADILKTHLGDLGIRGAYKIVTNLPYNITSAFFKKFLVEPPHPTTITAMIQKEVAERMTEGKGEGQVASMLTFFSQLYADCALEGTVGAGSFAPPPKVTSAIIHLKVYSEGEFSARWGIEHGVAEDLLSFAARAFAQQRKKISGTMGRKDKELVSRIQEALRGIGQSPDARPAALSIREWIELWKRLR